MNEFSTQLRHTIEAFNAPPVPLEAIRERGRRPASQRRRSSFSVAYAAIVLACSAASVALGAGVFHNLSITFNPSGNASITTPKLTCEWRATRQMVFYVSSLATYPMVLPAGLPAHAKITALCNAGPDALMLSYGYPRNGLLNGHLSLLIAPPAQMAVTRPTLARGVTVKNTNGGGKHWFVGSEEVLVLSSTLTNAQMEHVERAMRSKAR